MRYAYIKNGDAVDQIKRLSQNLGGGPRSGPDAFLYEYLMCIENNPIIILSRAKESKNFKYKNIEAHTFLFSGSLILKLFFATFSFLKTVYHLYRFKPDVVVCGKTGGMLWGSFIFSRLNKNIFIHSRHNRVIFSQGKILNKLISFIDNCIIRHSSSVICHGPYLKEQLVNIGVDPAKLFEFDVNYNDMYLNQKKIRFSNKEYESGGRSIMYIGRLEQDKGIFDLLIACLEIFEFNNNIELIFAGDGSARCKLQEMVDDYSLNDKVKLLGHVSHEDLILYMDKSLFIVAPTKRSFHEGRCMSAVESLIMGIPVIAPNFGPFPYLIKDRINGLLYHPDSATDLKLKIMELTKDDELRGKLQRGANYSAVELLNPEMSFGQALTRAISSN